MKKYLYYFLFLLALASLVWGIRSVFSSLSSRDEIATTAIVGVQHLGHNYNIAEFYVNKYSGTNVGREGGGGRIVCCVVIPSKWRSGLRVEVRWEVTDWSEENRKEIEAGNYRSVRRQGIYIAKVPVEKYDNPGDLYIHFFPEGRVRVVTTTHSVLSPFHPVPYGPLDSGPKATAGIAIKEMFTQAELREFENRRNVWN